MKGAVTDMVMVVKPLSTMSIVDLLNKSNINEVGGELEEKGFESKGIFSEKCSSYDCHY